MSILNEKEYILCKTKTLAALWKETPCIKTYLMEQKKLNPENWRPWFLFLIKIYKKIFDNKGLIK